MRPMIGLLIASMFLVLPLTPAFSGTLYTYTDYGNLITYDADTLDQTSGISSSNGGSTYDLTFDDTGRLYGEFWDNTGQHIVEYDPFTLAVTNQTTFSGGIQGLAARNGILYMYTEYGSLITYDADTLTQISGISSSNGGSKYDLTFDDTGRLYGEFWDGAGQHIVEYDPFTLAVTNQTTFSGGIQGLAAGGDVSIVPEPRSAILLLAGGTYFAGMRYIKRKKKT